MAYQSSTTVVFDHSAAIAGRLVRQAAELRHATAQRILAAAEANAPKDTEALSVSGYLVDETGSGYADAVAAAAGKNAQAEMLPDVQAEADTTIIAFAASYAAQNEVTNVAFLTPATEAERPAFEAAVAKLGEGLG